MVFTLDHFKFAISPWWFLLASVYRANSVCPLNYCMVDAYCDERFEFCVWDYFQLVFSKKTRSTLKLWIWPMGLRLLVLPFPDIMCIKRQYIGIIVTLSILMLWLSICLTFLCSEYFSDLICMCNLLFRFVWLWEKCVSYNLFLSLLVAISRLAVFVFKQIKKMWRIIRRGVCGTIVWMKFFFFEYYLSTKSN